MAAKGANGEMDFDEVERYDLAYLLRGCLIR